ncbi:hypothetical protein [Tessaracoccus defluvii]|uniref:Uncharacterized protein n=1 Tax=Tessaracoccus defluvii TaxID=1285901 RepID=A0A7H0H8E6_9ACTN|nr:hypothetical protein [Tessaracoccus defluvii]QNP56812.1 hypothetical protein H9L22_05500 [Tessaracoccus defluvii]
MLDSVHVGLHDGDGDGLRRLCLGHEVQRATEHEHGRDGRDQLEPQGLVEHRQQAQVRDQRH